MTDGRDLFDQYGSYAGIASLAATVRMMLSADRYTFYGRIRAYTLAAFVALLFYLFLMDSPLHAGVKMGMVGISALMADDILRALVSLCQKFLSKPLDLLADYFIKK